MSYINPGEALGMGIAFPAIGTIAIAGRLVIRAKRNALGFDDWLSIPAHLGVVCIGIIFIIGFATKTIGYHSPPQSSSEYLSSISPRQVLLEKFEVAILITGSITTGLLRLSVLFLYRRIFRGQLFNAFSWSLIAICTAWTVAFFFSTLFECRSKVDAAWGTVDDLLKYCVQTPKLLRGLTVSDFILNMLILALPVPFVMPLHMPPLKKIALLAVFFVGSGAVAASLARLVVVIRLTSTSVADVTEIGVNPNDEFGIINISIFWIYLELGIANIAICLPALRSLIDDRSVESIVHSVRSTISLRSLRSSGDSGPASKRVPGPRKEQEADDARTLS